MPTLTRHLLLFSLAALPQLAFAQSLQVFMVNLAEFLNDILIPFLIAIAFLVFVFNAIRYFVIGASNEEGREKARALALYGILAFVIIVVFAGIINLLTESIGLEGEKNPCPDYQKMRGDC